MKQNEELKIYKPRGRVIPLYEEYPATDNVTNPKNGRVYNRSIENVVLSKEETDANKK